MATWLAHLHPVERRMEGVCRWARSRRVGRCGTADENDYEQFFPLLYGSRSIPSLL